MQSINFGLIAITLTLAIGACATPPPPATAFLSIEHCSGPVSKPDMAPQLIYGEADISVRRDTRGQPVVQIASVEDGVPTTFVIPSGNSCKVSAQLR